MKRKLMHVLVAGVMLFTTVLPTNGIMLQMNISQVAEAATVNASWDEYTVYDNGDIVSYGGNLWKAGWYTVGDVPGTTGQWGVWQECGTVTEDQVPIGSGSYTKWNASMIYNTGDIVSYNGKNWIAGWYTRGDVPGTTGPWGVWKEYTSSTPTVAPTARPTQTPQPTQTPNPTKAPTTAPTKVPTKVPTAIPTQIITNGTPYQIHGALSVKGADLVDQNGKKYQLYGMSTHGIAWFPQYVSMETFKTLRDDWNTNAIRLAMYTDEKNGYCAGGDKEGIKRLVKQGVDYATELGMYVIIDWHILRDGNPLTYKSEAIKFFDEMSRQYAGYDNVLYEICNEPNGNASWDTIKSYANEVIPVIRANDPNSIIIVGTPTWSQDIDQALASPLKYDNVMYTLHFYAATHTDWLRNKMKNCIKAGLPVFISEFGTCDASGNGGLNYAQAEEWKKVIEEYNVSYFCWNLANKDESSSVIASYCSKVSGWSDSELSDQGKWIKKWFKSETNR